METALPIILITLSAVSMAAIGICYFCYKLTFKRSKSEVEILAPIKGIEHDRLVSFMSPLVEELSAAPCEEIRIASHDGLSLYARYYHSFDGAPIEIQMHGYRGRAFRDFCGGARDARARGHNLILVDQRAHGKSEGRAISFGINERLDCISWINYAIRRFGEESKIILIGISMGAATVLMASELGLPDNVKCIMADCPFSSPKDVISSVIRDMKLPPKLAYPFVRLGGIIFGGFDIEAASAKEAVKSSNVPTLIIHGELDTLVPCYMSREIYSNCKMKLRRLVTFENSEHGISYLLNKDEYLGAVTSFMNEALASGDTERKDNG